MNGQTESANLPQPAEDLSDNDVSSAISAIFHIPWGHNIVIVSKCRTQEEASFYVRQTLEHNWSRAVLMHQVESFVAKGDGLIPKPRGEF